MKFCANLATAIEMNVNANGYLSQVIPDHLVLNNPVISKLYLKNKIQF